MRIDSHQHFWELDNPFTNWPTEDLQPIYRDFLPEDLEEHLNKHGIDKTILVQAAPKVDETDFLLQLAENNERIAGVVGWLDLSSDQFPEQFFQYKNHPKFVGIRPMLQDLPDDRWILKEKVKKNIQILVEHDFPIDILIFPRHLPHIIELLDEFPTLRAVIDHCAKPNIKEKQWEFWAEGIEQVAKYESTMCKISGLVTEADHESWKITDFKPYIEHVVHCFGTNRVMFGSDWPVCLLAATYDEVIEIFTTHLPENLSEDEKKAVFGTNAMKFYKLNK